MSGVSGLSMGVDAICRTGVVKQCSVQCFDQVSISDEHLTLISRSASLTCEWACQGHAREYEKCSVQNCLVLCCHSGAGSDMAWARYANLSSPFQRFLLLLKHLAPYE